MNPFINRSYYEIQEAIRKILEDAEREIEEHPDRREQIKSFCEKIIETNNIFFDMYKSKVVLTPIFDTKEDEKSFFKIANKEISSKTGLHWEGKHDDER